MLADSEPRSFNRQLPNPAAKRGRIAQPKFQQGSRQLKILKPSRGQLARQKVMDFETKRRDTAQPERFETFFPTVGKARNFGRHHVHIKSMSPRKLRAAPQFRVQTACGLCVGSWIQVALLGKQNFGGRPAAVSVNGLRPDEEELAFLGDARRGAQGHFKLAPVDFFLG